MLCIYFLNQPVPHVHIKAIYSICDNLVMDVLSTLNLLEAGCNYEVLSAFRVLRGRLGVEYNQSQSIEYISIKTQTDIMWAIFL